MEHSGTVVRQEAESGLLLQERSERKKITPGRLLVVSGMTSICLCTCLPSTCSGASFCIPAWCAGNASAVFRRILNSDIRLTRWQSYTATVEESFAITMAALTPDAAPGRTSVGVKVLRVSKWSPKR